MRRALAATCIVAALVVGAAPASAKLDAGDLKDAKLRTKSINPGGENDVAGSVGCPKRMRVLTGGAFWHQRGEPPKVSYGAFGSMPTLTGSGPIAGGRRWYAQGRGVSAVDAPNLRLTIVVRCLPKGKLRHASTRKVESQPPDGDPTGQGVLCPAGKQAISGGAIWHPAGAAPNAGDASKAVLTSSTVTANGRGWYADGWDNWVTVPPDMVLRIIVRCLPAGQLADTAYRERTFLSVPDDQPAGGRVRCKRKRRALTGGAFWHAPSGADPPAGNFGIFGGSNSFTRGNRGWFAAGLNFHAGGVGGPRSMTITALCLKR